MADYTAENLVEFGGEATITYHKRARDSGVPPPTAPVYFYWQTISPTGAYVGPPAPVGALVDEVNLSITVA